MAQGNKNLDSYEYDQWLVQNKKERELRARQVERRNANKGYSSGTIEYWGSYISLLADMVHCLSVRVPDYPDSREIDKNINMYFKDYI